MSVVKMTDDTIRSCFRLIHEVLWREFSANKRFQWYYAERCVYLIMDDYTDAVWFVFAPNPFAALRMVMEKIEKSAKLVKENN